MSSIVWLRRDLRLIDNPALSAAAAQGPVLVVYIHAPEEEAPWQPGAASNWWLHHSLQALAADLAEQGCPLLIKQGHSQQILEQLVKASGAERLLFNRLYEPACLKRDREVTDALSHITTVESFNSALLLEPWEIQTKSKTPFRVFTPFWKTGLAQLQHSENRVLAAPSLNALQHQLPSLDISELGLLGEHNWHQKLDQHWQPGEQSALKQLAEFLSTDLDDYQQHRDIPGLDASSKLSPHLHFGEISPRQIFTAVNQRPPSRNDQTILAHRQYLNQLGWREFAHHLLFHYPHTSTQPLNPKFQHFPWWQASHTRENDPSQQQLRRWQRGETGISLVDAGMQQLWQSGWMHNRVRMVVASLLTKNLGIHWLEGASWFWDTLVDANLANNSLGWQWTAGCGADAAPYFRVFNPDTQAQRFDTDGSYRRQWLGHRFAERKPQIDLKLSRQQALAAYTEMKARAE